VYSDVHYWQFFNGATSNILKQNDINIAGFYWKRVNLPITTLFQSKSYSFLIPNSQSLETNVNLAIRPKTKISSMLLAVPVINEINWCVNCFAPSLPSHSEHSDAQLWYIGCSNTEFWLKSDRSLDVVFKPIQIFFAPSCAKFHVQTSGWAERFKQPHRQYLILD